MKSFRSWLIVFLVVALGISLGCAKKAIRSDVVSTPSQRAEPKAVETKAMEKPEEVSPESKAALEKEKKLQEENLREEALREKALREKALREQSSKKEASAREAEVKAAALESIYFDYDQWTIRENQKEPLLKNSEWLKSNPNIKIRLEGHCDERGTSEYNLALGQKRAEAVKVFLEGLGVGGQRIAPVSYGKERPLDPGHDDAAWAKNRRVDIVPIR